MEYLSSTRDAIVPLRPTFEWTRPGVHGSKRNLERTDAFVVTGIIDHTLTKTYAQHTRA